ncbi:NAD(P)-binding protein [Trichodelitschia bisporula]|uniref:NAD(P)-binding protein n=1 Tax=Trichodelitschia bisporula TaxID=703511 RepID=A0A6G1HLE4_9PEZI|nr:NAD(P)-binding protein [Trichodelitschia bisporula]
MASSFAATDLFNVNGIVAVVSGGGTGLGRMMAKALAHNGARKVYIIGRRKDRLEAAAQEGPPGVIIPVVGDITSQTSLQEIAAQVQAEVGFIHLLVCNAGINGPGAGSRDEATSLDEFVEKAWAVPTAEFTDTFNVNITSVYYTVLAFLKLLDAGNNKENLWAEGVSSQIVTISSAAAFSRSRLVELAYGASKAGVTHLAKHLASEFSHWKIRSNIIAPGFYPSEMTVDFMGGKDLTKEGSMPHTFIPVTRIGTESEMAGHILSLVSRAGAYTNGTVVLTDGGALAVSPSTY